MRANIYFPFSQYEKEIHSEKSSYSAWQMENAVYDNSGKVCAYPYETAAPFLKSSIDWMWYLIDAPAEYFRYDFSKFSDLELYFLLRERVELSLIAPWQNMAEEYRKMLLAYHPELARDISELQELSGDHWQKILQIEPKYAVYCPWQKLTGNNWQVVLEEHPELACFCDFGKLTVKNWQELLKKQIRFLTFCPTAIKKCFSCEERESLFIIYPEIRKQWDLENI